MPSAEFFLFLLPHQPDASKQRSDFPKGRRESVVSLMKWFSTVQQFFEKIVKCLGPLDQSDKCCQLGDNGLSTEGRTEGRTDAGMFLFLFRLFFFPQQMNAFCGFSAPTCCLYCASSCQTAVRTHSGALDAVRPQSACPHSAGKRTPLKSSTADTPILYLTVATGRLKTSRSNTDLSLVS